MVSGLNSADMRFSNEMLVLNSVRDGGMSRAQLAKLTGLTRAGIAFIVDQLIEKKFLREGERAVSEATGRRSTFVEIEKNSWFAVGIALTRHSCKTGIVNLIGDIIADSKVTLEESDSPESCLRQACEKIHDLIRNNNLDPERTLGIGISMPGPVDVDEGRAISSSSVWNDIPVREIAESYFSVPCVLKNTSIAQCLYEKNYGVGKDLANFLYIKLGDVIGGGVVVDGRPLSGFRGFGNELGHISIDFKGPVCSCGNRGCLNLYASVPALLSRYPGTSFRNWEDIVDAFYLGKSDAIAMLYDEIDIISTALTGFMNIFESDAIILGGDLAYRPQIVQTLISDKVNSARMLHDTRKIPFIIASQDDFYSLRSAAYVFLDEFFAGAFPIKGRE